MTHITVIRPNLLAATTGVVSRSGFSVSWALVGLLAVRWHSTPREFARMNYKPAGAPNCAFSIVLVDLAPFFNVFLETSSNSTKAHTHTQTVGFRRK